MQEKEYDPTQQNIESNVIPVSQVDKGYLPLFSHSIYQTRWRLY